MIDLICDLWFIWAILAGRTIIYLIIVNWNKINKVRWEIAKILRGKRYIAIKPTMRCNMNCYYCGVNNAGQYYPGNIKTPVKYEEKTPLYWIKLISRVKPDVLTISGGEPGLYYQLSEIVNYAVSKGVLVQIISNMTEVAEFNKITPTWRVNFIHTRHPGIKHHNYDKVDFPVTVRVLKNKPDRKTRHEKKIINHRDDGFRLIYGPDGTLYDSCDGVSLRDNAIVTEVFKK